MPTRALTAAAVERIKAPKQGQQDHFDKGYPGLALRISYGGSKTWVCFFRLHSKQHRLTLGSWPAMGLSAARDAWREARNKVGIGESPKPKRPVQADSFEAVAEEWLKRDQAQRRSVAEVRRVIERDVKPVWGDRPIGSITRRDVFELIDSIADRGAVTMARRTQAHLHRLWRWAVGRGIIETNPLADLPKPGKVVRRDRVLTDAELALVWKAAAKMDWPFGPYFQLLILTAARRNEISALRWSEIDGDVIKLTGERTKNNEPHTIPLSPQAATIIENLDRIVGSEFVFTTNGGKSSVSGWSKAKAQLDARITELNKGRQLPAWRVHDLRRTCATGLQKLGTRLEVIEAVLGHVSGSRGGIVGVYQRHAFDDEKRAALEAWARHVEQLLSGKPAKVIILKRG